MPRIPASPEEFTAEWLNTVLSNQLGTAKVVDVDVRDSDIPGQTAEIAKILVRYDDPSCPLPSAMIAKYTSRNQDMINVVINIYQQYWRETSFYTEFPEPGIAVPRCLYTAHVPDTQAFVILMADLAPSESPSWVPTPDQVALALSQLPAFHAKWWNSPELLSKDWLVQGDNRAFYGAAASAAAASVPKLTEIFGDKVEVTVPLMQQYLGKLDQVLAYLAQRPFTLVHGDYHPKQIFFPTESGGEFAVIDWQFSFVAQGAWDFVRMMTLGLSVEERRARETALIEQYHQGLLASGVTNYSLAELQDDLRLGLIVNQMIMCVAVADTDIAIFEKECAAIGADWQDVIILRGEAALADWDVLGFLERL